MEQEFCKWVNLKNPVYIKYHNEEWVYQNMMIKNYMNY